MRTKFAFLVFFIFASAVLPVMPFTAAQEETLQNDVFEIREVRLGGQTTGVHLFSALVSNRTEMSRNFAIDIRTEGLGLGRPNWQRQLFFPLNAHESRRVEAEYEVASPLLYRILLRMGEAPEYDKWARLSEEERLKTPYPEIKVYWRKEFPAKTPISPEELRDSAFRYSVYLSTTSPERLAEIKQQLPALTKRSRTEEPLRARLHDLFGLTRTKSGDYDYRDETWNGDAARWGAIFESAQVRAQPFSISGAGGNRISAFVATRKVDATRELPIIFLLSGNPPGTKESLVGTAIYFAALGFHAVGIDRRETSRTLDTKAKFLTNFSDPVKDALRIIDFFGDQKQYSISKIGLFGFSAGAMEGKFIAALDDRISAVVLACGTASHNSFFEDDAWVPTYSGMIIFPELGLGHPEIGKLTREEFFANLSKVKPEHNSRAREIFRQVFPYFEDLDPLKVTPLIAPVPLLIVSGAQDSQFKPSGVVEVDEATQAAYRKFGLPMCSELYLEPRADHTVDSTASSLIAAFYERWLR
jgi:pimeloyl-ACP methyl ester carboxylesterase